MFRKIKRRIGRAFLRKRASVAEKAYIPRDTMSLIENRLIEIPYIAYGLLRASMEAKALGFTKMTAIEFGVAGGRTLLKMEKLCCTIGDEVGIEIALLGFDTGEGMPEATDYRDLGYIWKKGFFKMNPEELIERLQHAHLVLGDIAQTLPGCDRIDEAAPVGFISIDVDYYSSTKSVLKLFELDCSTRLPRVFCYLDDTVGDHWEQHSDFAGELLAVSEYNENCQRKKIARINGLSAKLPASQGWEVTVFVHHDFFHPLYNKHIHPNKSWQLPLGP